MMMNQGQPSSTPAITPMIERDVTSSLKSAFPDTILSVSTEIQDGGLFLLIVADVTDTLPIKEVATVMQKAGNLIAQKVPKRQDEYSWIFNLHQRGKLIDSLSGGWMKEDTKH